ncbi:MAG: class I SAM-dependent methyltransferase [candidate division WOR-3 bacterium]|nr:class I SAM-dependent methyltransferase [candidate division WOR-3 bacterium]
MDISEDKDYFEIYLNAFPNAPSLVLVRSIEAKHFPKSYIKEPILDLCCGDGFFGSMVLKGHANTVGCDIDGLALKRAISRSFYKEVLNSDARYLTELPSDFFSTVISNCALEHIDGIDKAISSIYRVLKKGGTLIFSVPTPLLNEVFLELKNDEELQNRFNLRQRHINIINFVEWEKILLNSGFTVLEKFYVFDKQKYKKVVYWDALPEISPFKFKLWSLLTKVTPKSIIKKYIRFKLKPIFMKSEIIREQGGELIVVATKT